MQLPGNMKDALTGAYRNEKKGSANMIFIVMDKDKKISEVTVKENIAEVKHYVSGVMYPFYKADHVPLSAVRLFIESRCFDRNRPDREELLNALHLTEYNPYEIVKKTKGKMAHDGIWIDWMEE